MTDTGSEISQNQPAMERGLLDLSVTLSTRNITAGKQFAIFVLVKNPFDKPVWVRQVHVSLPSELKLAGTQDKKHKETRKNEDNRIKNDSQQRKEEQIVRLESKLDILNTEFSKISSEINNKESLEESTKDFLKTLEAKINEIQYELKNLTIKNQTNINTGDALKVGNLRIISKQANINVGHEAKVGYLEIYEPESFAEVSSQARKVDLESSLPRNVALQPGSTVVYTAILYVEKSIVFTPSQYRLQVIVQRVNEN
jgi:hypothetical protein